MAARSRNPGLAKGDEVYAQHPKLGPVAVKVLAHGVDGFTGQCGAGRRHKLGYDTVLGHKAKVLQSYSVVDQGADGAILQDDGGQRRFVRHTGAADAGDEGNTPGNTPSPHPAAGEGEERDDPLLDRRDMLKATSADASPAQLEAGNYTKHRVQFQGLPVTIENRAGSMRRGVDAGGHEWAVRMEHDYGYIRGTLGVDGDHFDVLLGPDQDAEQAFLFTLRCPPAFTKDDEQKAFLGFPDEGAARRAFDGMYDNPRFLGAVHAMPMERFKAMVMTTRDEPRFLKASENITGNMTEPRLVLFLKGGPVANRAGLALKDVTDRAGHHTKRWTKTTPDQPGQARRKAPMEHGKLALFRHGDVQGKGRIVGSGRDGVTIHDGQREHQVRHADLLGAAPEPAASARNSETAGKQGVAAGIDRADGTVQATIPPDKFDANAFAQQHNDPSVTAADILKGFPPDTAAKLNETNEKLAKATQTIDTFKKDGVYTPERAALHQGIIDSILSDERIKAAQPAEGQAPTFTILGGRGGSGKSWFEGQVFHPDNAIVLDADAIKQKLPEYEGWNAAVVHEESGDIFDTITATAKALGLNIVHDATMKTAKKAVALVQGFKDDGYRTEAHYMYLPPQEAAKRAVSRFLGPTKRFVPPGIVLGNTTNEGSFDQVKGLVDKWSFRDNNVAKGQPPKLISESAGNEADGREPGRDGLPPAGPGDRGKGERSAGKSDGGRTEETLAKALRGDAGGVAPRLMLKAIIPGGAAGDLLAMPVQVSGHTRKSGTYVAPHIAIRHVHAPEPQTVEQPSPETKHFYVSAQDGAKHHLVAGPYASHDEAKAMQPHVQRHAEQHQPDRAHFMAWGTSGSAAPLKTPLGENWKPSDLSGKWTGDDRHVGEIMAAIRQSPHKHHALRVMTPRPDQDNAPEVAVGQSLNPSYRWNDGEPTNRQLKGTSGVGIRTEAQARDAVKKLGSYFGQQVVLIGGDEARPGADDGEKLIGNAKVLRAWKRRRVGVGRGLLPDGHADYD